MMLDGKEKFDTEKLEQRNKQRMIFYEKSLFIKI